MSDDFQARVTAAMANPENMGELPNADAIGTVGNADCGDMLRVWVKFKEEGGRKVIDRASFQSFGCETAIAAASLAMELIRGKTPPKPWPCAAKNSPGPRPAAADESALHGPRRGRHPPGARARCATGCRAGLVLSATHAGCSRTVELDGQLQQARPEKGGVKVVFLRESEPPA